MSGTASPFLFPTRLTDDCVGADDGDGTDRAATYHECVIAPQLNSSRLRNRKRLLDDECTLLKPQKMPARFGSDEGEKSDSTSSNGGEPDQVHRSHLPFDNSDGGGSAHSGAAAGEDGEADAGVSCPACASEDAEPALTPADVAWEAYAATDFQRELRRHAVLFDLAATCIAQVIDDEGVSDEFRRSAEDILMSLGHGLLLRREDDERRAYLDARDAGDVDQDGEPIPSPRYYGA